MDRAPYCLRRPEKRTSCVLFTSPHSGSTYTPEMLKASVLDPLTLRSSEDAYVDLLFENVPAYGTVFLSALYPRAWVDLNRRADELDPALIKGVQNKSLNPRVLSGLGVIPRVVAGGRNIYNGKITQAEAELRLKTIWKPYHQMVDTLLQETRALFGRSLMVDCHSMPHDALKETRPGTGQRSEIVIGDRYGASARPAIVAEVEAAFSAEGFTVSRNTPFAGAYIAQHYGRPFQNQNVVQVEIDRSLYMDEKTLERSNSYDDVKVALDRAARRIAQFGAEDMSVAAQ